MGSILVEGEKSSLSGVLEITRGLISNNLECKDSGVCPRTHVTLTYAQSLDGSISAERGKPTPISSPASFEFTHRLRALHQGILVGLPTVQSDNPSLSVRHCPGQSPTVIILDPTLSTPPGCKILREWAGLEGRRATPPRLPLQAPIILHGDSSGQEGFDTRRDVLLSLGAQILHVPSLGSPSDSLVSEMHSSCPRRHLDLYRVMELLASPPFCIRSLLVEGGAGVHHSFLEQHRANAGLGRGPLVSAIAVTVAPTYLLGGLHIGDNCDRGLPRPPSFPMKFDFVERVGADIVLLATPCI